MLRSRILWKLFTGYVILILLSTTIVGFLVSKHIQKEALIEIDNDSVFPNFKHCEILLFRIPHSRAKVSQCDYSAFQIKHIQEF